MCDDITCENVHLPSVARMDDMICDDLTCEDLTPDVCENVVLGLLI